LVCYRDGTKGKACDSLIGFPSDLVFVSKALWAEMLRDSPDLADHREYLGSREAENA
jgi:hypothetical protein